MVTALASSGARATYLGADTATRGSWVGVYGGEGYNVLGEAAATPPSIQLAATGHEDYTWSESTDDVRAVQKVLAPGRIAGLWYASETFSVNLDLTDGRTHRVALYFLDWDRADRAQSIEILDGSAGTVLNRQTLANFSEGVYLLWDLKGRIQIRLTRLGGPNVVLGALFFDSRINPSNGMAVAPMLSSLAQVAVGADGFQLRVSGEALQPYVLEASRDLLCWSPICTNALGNSAVDVIGLQPATAPYQFYRARSLHEPTEYLIQAVSK
jgi:hypothetical protein